MMRSLYGRIKGVYGVVKTVGGGDSTSAAVQLNGAKSIACLVEAGVFALTSTNKVTVRLLDSTDGTTYGTAADTDIDGGTNALVLDSSASHAQKIHQIYYKGTGKYVKCLLSESGTVSIPMAVTFVVGDLDLKPTPEY